MKITKEKIGLVLLAATIITNPLPGQYVEDAISRTFQLMFLYGYWISLVTAGYAVVIFFIYYHQSTRVNIPAKPKKA